MRNLQDVEKELESAEKELERAQRSGMTSPKFIAQWSHTLLLQEEYYQSLHYNKVKVPMTAEALRLKVERNMRKYDFPIMQIEAEIAFRVKSLSENPAYPDELKMRREIIELTGELIEKRMNRSAYELRMADSVNNLSEKSK